MTMMWGGHSCPPPLRLVFDFQKFGRSEGLNKSVQIESKTENQKSKTKNQKLKPKINFKGGGQECPPHTLSFQGREDGVDA